MKKEYLKPEMVVEELLFEGMLANSTPVGDDYVTPLTNQRNNAWSQENWKTEE